MCILCASVYVSVFWCMFNLFVIAHWMIHDSHWLVCVFCIYSIYICKLYNITRLSHVFFFFFQKNNSQLFFRLILACTLLVVGRLQFNFFSSFFANIYYWNIFVVVFPSCFLDKYNMLVVCWCSSYISNMPCFVFTNSKKRFFLTKSSKVWPKLIKIEIET